MDEMISEKIVRGEITALSLDTSIFEKNGLALESGLLAQLAQFRAGGMKLIITHTVFNEVKRHITKNANDATKALRSSLSKTAKHRSFRTVDQESLDALFTTASNGDETRPSLRLDTWAKTVGAEVILEEPYVSVSEVMRRYEASEPPFAATGGKKKEFPDAVALLTLEGWAKAFDTKILAVSADDDWKSYAAQSERLVVVDDLADALATVQGVGAARQPAERLAALFLAGDLIGLNAAFLEATKSQVDNISFHIDVDSQFSVEEDGHSVTVRDVEIDIPDATGNTLDTISFDDGYAVIKVSGIAAIDVDVYFSFEKFDSIDRDYIPMGSTTISQELEVAIELLVSVIVDDDQLSLDGLELLPTTEYLSFNDLEPDWMSHPDPDDSYDRG